VLGCLRPLPYSRQQQPPTDTAPRTVDGGSSLQAAGRPSTSCIETNSVSLVDLTAVNAIGAEPGRLRQDHAGQQRLLSAIPTYPANHDARARLTKMEPVT
jgi:hypothetical protein